MRKSLSTKQNRLPRRFRPKLECLEDRSVPATLFVNTTLDDVTDGNGKLSLREAIGQANKHPGADVIVLPAGVFNITRAGASDDLNATGDFDILDSVTITGAGRNLTLIDGQQVDRVFQVIGSSPGSIGVVLARLTVRNGKIDAPGGGVAVTNANLLVRDANVSGNQAIGATGNGGGLFADSAATIKLVRSRVERNVAGNFGGGIDATSATLFGSVVQRNIAVNAGGVGASTATLTNCTVNGNNASGTGGGIFVFGTATLTNCTVSGNSADGVGGIRADTATLTNCTVSGNSASGTGGGIGANTATLNNSTVSGNAAGIDGGGIFTVGTATLTNCTVGGNSASRIGGGISAGTTATLTNSKVSSNSAGGGGGGLTSPIVSLKACTISGNKAGNNGGGFSATTATLTNCTVSGNSAGTFGGGLSASTATLTNCTVSGNASGSLGGGIEAGTASLTNCTVRGNASGSLGGGVEASTATLTNCTVSGNSAQTSGGGIAVTTATLTNCTVAGNTAQRDGGGVFASGATLLNCTIAENIAQVGGGIFRQPLGEAFNVKNTIVALNLVLPGGIGPDVAGDVFTSLGHNLIGDGTGGAGFTNGVNNDIVGTSQNPIDPKLGPLASNGGPTQTYKLFIGSPAIDAGDNLVVELTDQRGRPRRRDGNSDGSSIIDIGAFER